MMLSINQPRFNGRRQIETRLKYIPGTMIFADIIREEIQKPYGWDINWYSVYIAPNGAETDKVLLFVQAVITGATPGSNETYTSPPSWVNSANTIEVLGAGASGAAIRNNGSPKATGGGAGAYSKITNFSFADPGVTTATFNIGIGGVAITKSASSGTNGNNGGPTWFNNETNPGVGTDNTKVSAAGGSAGLQNAAAATLAGGAGGTVALSWGQTKYAGGAGGSVTSTTAYITGTGGGAPGITNTGGAGTDTASASTATAGGAATGDSGGTSGAGSFRTTTGSATSGGVGTYWTSQGAGGGGGGVATSSASLTITAGSGGLYGAAGGGAAISRTTGTAVSGAGTKGLIVLTWTPIPRFAVNLAMNGM